MAGNNIQVVRILSNNIIIADDVMQNASALI